MKSTLETVSTLERKLNIEVPAAEVQEAIQNAIKGVQKHVTLKGFRKGKAPATAVKMAYGDRVKQDVQQDIMQMHYVRAIKEHELDPISYPTFEWDELQEGKPFQFAAEFEVRPEVKIKKIDGLAVKKEKLAPGDELVNKTLEDIRKGRAETAPVLETRAAEEGDVAVIDFKGFVDGQPLENGSAEGHELELGSSTFIPGFEEGVIGMSPGGSHTIQVSFPADYHVAELAGKPVEFQVKLQGLKKKVLPELNDEFAKGLGQYENLEALKKAILDDFEKREGKRVQEDLRNRLMKALVDNNPVSVPKALLANQKKVLIEDFEKRMEQQGMPSSQFEDYKSKWDDDFEQTASYMIQSSFLIDKIATEQKLVATDEDVKAKLREYAQTSNIELDRLSEFYKEGERASRLQYQITEEKVLDFLLSKAKLEEVPREQLEKEPEAQP